jgi:hypothetical protein
VLGNPTDKIASAKLNSNLVLELVTDHSCEGKFGVLSTFAFDSPLAILPHDVHSVPRSPPTVDFSRQCEPDFLPPTYPAQENQQIPIDAPCLLVSDVVGMDDEAHESVFSTVSFVCVFNRSSE